MFKVFIAGFLGAIFFTNSLATNIKLNKADEKISVLTFGAKGDGQTNDEDALEKAISYCIKNNKICYIPKTVRFYNIKSTIRVPLEPGQSIEIVSDGASIKPLAPPANNTAFSLTPFNEHVFLSIGKQINSIRDNAMFKNSEGSSVSISGLVFDGSNLPEGVAPTTLGTSIFIGLQVLAETVNINNCVFKNLYGYGLTIYNVKNSTMKECRFENVGGRGATPFVQKIDRDAFGDGVHFSLVKADGNVTMEHCVFLGKKIQNKRSRSAITFEFSTQPYNIFLSNVNISGFAKCIHIEETSPTKVHLNYVNMSDFNFGIANVLNDNSTISFNHVRMDVGLSDGNDYGEALAFLNYRSKAQIFIDNSYLNFNGKKESYQSAGGLVKVENSTINGNNTNFFFADGNTLFDHCIFVKFGGAQKSFFSNNGQSVYKITNSDLKKSSTVHANGQKLKLSIQ